VILLLAAYLSRNSLLGPWLLNQAEPILAELLGAPVELEGISGSWWDGIELARARSLEDGQLTPVRSFELTEIELRYSLREFLRGEANWLHAVRAESVTLILDATQGKDHPAPDEPSDPLHLPARLQSEPAM